MSYLGETDARQTTGFAPIQQFFVSRKVVLQLTCPPDGTRHLGKEGTMRCLPNPSVHGSIGHIAGRKEQL